MRRWLAAGVAAGAVVLAAGFVFTFIPRMRRAAAQAGCANHLRELGLFAAHHAAPAPGADPARFSPDIPAGTVPLPGVAPADRLSWLPRVLPGLDPKRHGTGALLDAVTPADPFAAPANQAAARVRLRVALCPGNVPPLDPAAPAPTCYVGVTGVGADAALLLLPDPPAPAPPRAGCFRYDRPTPFAAVADGLSQTFLLAERSGDLGPWLRGGPGTVRGLDDGPAAAPLLGAGGQFGGNHAAASNWGFADGSVRVFTDRTAPRVLFDLATLAGKETDPLPGE